MTSTTAELAVQPGTIAAPVHQSDKVKLGTLFKAVAPSAGYRQRFTPASANLEWLSCGEYE